MTRRSLSKSPAFSCYLLALAALPFRWLSPIASLQQHGEWSDVLAAIALALWVWERTRDRELARSIRRWHLPLALYLILSCVSAALAPGGRGASWTTVLLSLELAGLAVITADFAASAPRRRTIARVIVGSSLVTAALALLGLILFYAGVHSGLVGPYGELQPSSLYARVQAGFESPPLLSSYCIFASGIVARKDAGLTRRFRVLTQISLGVLCAATISRGLLGFVLAVVIRRSATMRGGRRVALPLLTAAASLAILATLTVGLLVINPSRHWNVSYLFPSPSSRRVAFTSSLSTLEHHPLFGIGPGALPGQVSAAQYRAHFTPLNIAATLGLPALCAFVAVLWLIWRGRQRPTDLALWSALAGIALDGLTQDIDHFRHVWVLLGLLAGEREPARQYPPQPIPGVPARSSG